MMGISVGSGVGVAVALGGRIGLGVAVGVGVKAGVALSVGVGVRGSGVGVGTSVGAGVGVSAGVTVGAGSGWAQAVSRATPTNMMAGQRKRMGVSTAILGRRGGSSWAAGPLRSPFGGCKLRSNCMDSESVLVLYVFQDKRGGFTLFHHFSSDRASFEFPVVGDDDFPINPNLKVYLRRLETDVR